MFQNNPKSGSGIFGEVEKERKMLLKSDRKKSRWMDFKMERGRLKAHGLLGWPRVMSRVLKAQY